MSGVRVAVGTRKGAFILTSDGSRREWDVSGPHLGGWEIYHVKGSTADPDRLYASQSSGWFGQIIQRSDDGGQTWNPVGNDFRYEGEVHPHQWYDGTPHPWEFARVWHLEPSPTDPDRVYAGAEDAALFVSDDAGQTWAELPGSGATGPPRAGSRARAACASTRSSSTGTTPTGSSPPSLPPAPSAATTAAAPGGRSTRASIPRESPTPTPRSGTVSTTSPPTRPVPRCCSCRSTGTSCAATTPASRGGR